MKIFSIEAKQIKMVLPNTQLYTFRRILHLTYRLMRRIHLKEDVVSIHLVFWNGRMGRILVLDLQKV